MTRFLSLIGAAALSLATPQTTAADVLVELYTSQGCSSCPPADEDLADLAKRPGVIALSLHVDYWDYLGWKDSFSNPVFTERQRLYAQTAGSTMIYTPQMVIAGQDFVVGSKAMQVLDSVMAHAKKVPPVTIDLARRGGDLVIEAAAVDQVPSGMVVFLVQYSPAETVEISRGENAGNTLTYHNVVKSWTQIATWDGAAPLQVTGGVSQEMPAVVIVQDGASGPVLAAARID